MFLSHLFSQHHLVSGRTLREACTFPSCTATPTPPSDTPHPATDSSSAASWRVEQAEPVAAMGAPRRQRAFRASTESGETQRAICMCLTLCCTACESCILQESLRQPSVPLHHLRRLLLNFRQRCRLFPKHRQRLPQWHHRKCRPRLPL